MKRLSLSSKLISPLDALTGCGAAAITGALAARRSGCGDWRGASSMARLMERLIFPSGLMAMTFTRIACPICT
jgi:hypothetical protein